MSRKAGFWVADVANTRTKLAPVRGGKLGRRLVMETAKLTRVALRDFLPESDGVPLVMASVVPAKGKLLAAAWQGKVFSVKGRNAPGIEFDYPKPEELGADRIANAVAAKALYGTPVVVMDFGTVLDVEVVDAAGKFIGGALAPGWDLMVGALAEHTALLPKVEWKKPRRAIARSTQEAILSGCYHGYRGKMRELLTQIRKELNVRKVKLIVTGGQGRMLAEGLPEVTAVNPLLTLEGLRIMGEIRYGKSN